MKIFVHACEQKQHLHTDRVNTVLWLRWHTADRGGTGGALAAELLQRVDSYVEVDVLTVAAIIHQLLLVKSLKQKWNSGHCQNHNFFYWRTYSWHTRKSVIKAFHFQTLQLNDQWVMLKPSKRCSKTKSDSSLGCICCEEGVIHTIWKAMSSDGQNLTHSSMKAVR